MTAGSERRARALVRCYPRAWQARYGHEFTLFLLDDIAERPHSLSRTADVVATGLLTRLAYAGVTGDVLEPEQQVRTGLKTLSAALSAFLVLGISIWSQLTIGWQWSAPAAPATRAGMLVMTATMAGFALLASLAVIPLIALLGRELLRGRAPRLATPLLAAALGGAVLFLGSMHFGHGWPGTGGHPWAGRDVVPAWVARFCWAATLWVTSYWAHPGALASFPAAEIGWMVVSPIATVLLLLGAAGIVRRLPLSPTLQRYQCRLGLCAGLVMAVFLAGAVSWVLSGGPGPRGLFRVGVIDSIGVAVMAAAVLVAFRVACRTLATRATCAAATGAPADAPAGTPADAPTGVAASSPSSSSTRVP